MSNIINPYNSSRANLQQRTDPAQEADDETQNAELNRADRTNRAQLLGHESLAKNTVTPEVSDSVTGGVPDLQEVDETSSDRFKQTLEGAFDRKEDVQLRVEDHTLASRPMPGLSVDEQQMIYRYFPESPSLELRLYKPDLSTNKVDPGSIGSRVDLRG